MVESLDLEYPNIHILQDMSTIIYPEILGDDSDVTFKMVADMAQTLVAFSNYFIRESGVVVATGSLDLKYLPWGVTELQNIAVRTGYKRRGYGHEMVDSLERIAARAGSTLMRLTYLHDAASFYESLGYIHLEKSMHMAKSLV